MLKFSSIIVSLFFIIKINQEFDVVLGFSSSCLSVNSQTKTKTIQHNNKPLFGSMLDQEASSALYEEQEKLLTARGVLEKELMAEMQSEIIANTPNVKVKTVGGGGFGSASSDGKTKKSSASPATLKAMAKSHVKVLQEEGVVRIDQVLDDATAEKLRDYVFHLRSEAESEVESGNIDARQRFANVLLKKNRCDLTIPIGNQIVYDALNSVLRQSPVGQVMRNLLGKDAVLYELSCLMSDPGSDRQVVHPDTPCNDDNEDPVLYTCFIALQDIDMTMGPTSWIPKTHNKKSHETFNDKESPEEGVDSPKDNLLRTTPSVVGLLPRGSCGIFDSRLLHCGNANQSENKRALFYLSFKNPKIGYPGNPGSIRRGLINKLNLSLLDKELKLHEAGKPCVTLDSIASSLV